MRTLKRGILATASVAALLLCATSVQAATVNLVIDQTASSLTMGGKIDASSIGGAGFKNLPFVPQAAGSNITSYTGTIDIDDLGATLQLLTSSNVVAAVNGNWAPLNVPSNYGLAIPGIALTSQFTNMTFNWGIPVQASTLFPVTPVLTPPMAVLAGSFNLSGQGAAFTGASTYSLASGLGNGAGNVTGAPIISFGSTGADIGTWDGTTLTLPVHSTVTTVIQASPLVLQYITMTGQIVARVVPEPSSFIMAGLGVVGLIATGYRARKRKA